MTFNIKIEAKSVTNTLEHKIAAIYARESGPALEEIAGGIIAAIRKRRIWDIETKGILKKGLWRGKPRYGDSGTEIDMGWSGEGAAFGPGHEWGFKKSEWRIRPVGVRTSTRHVSTRLGQPIKALRFVVGGRVCYARGVKVSAPRKRKPHFAPAAKAYPIQARMGRVLDSATRRAGL